MHGQVFGHDHAIGSWDVSKCLQLSLLVCDPTVKSVAWFWSRPLSNPSGEQGSSRILREDGARV